MIRTGDDATLEAPVAEGKVLVGTAILHRVKIPLGDEEHHGDVAHAHGESPIDGDVGTARNPAKRHAPPFLHQDTRL